MNDNSPLNEMVERVAKGLCEEDGGSWPIAKDWPRGSLYRHRAYVAIKAMREPTEAMLVVGYKTGEVEFNPKFAHMQAARIYEAMIDEALK